MELSVYDRNYSKWEFKPTNELEPVLAITAYIHPLISKLFHGDILSTSGSLLHSPYQRKDNIPGVLILEGKTYGRANIKDKLLYKCIPHDPALPCFLIPYEEKVATFNKKKINKYITFKFKDWRDKHPLGQLTQTIGDVNEPEHYYQYQVASKYLQQSISTLTKETMANLNMQPREKMAEHIAMKQQMADRRSEPIFSIDPAACKDIDDAIGLRVIDKEHSIVSIYIANVPLILDYLNLWQACSERVSTIYLPTSKLPMLPPILSDDVCSLLQGKDRCAFCLDLYIEHKDNENTTVTKVVFSPVLINVKKNYVYEEDLLLKNKTYNQLFQLTK
jgi:exoribonuclease R